MHVVCCIYLPIYMSISTIYVICTVFKYIIYDIIIYVCLLLGA